MTARTRRIGRGLVLGAVVAAAFGRGQGGEVRGQGADRPVAVEPGDLTRRKDLVGREVFVDDRVSRLQFHPGKGFDQIYLRRCPEVVFELPERLRPQQPTQPSAVKVCGVLRKDSDAWVCDVTALEVLPPDLARLNAAVSTLPRSDADTRTSWARWAEARADAFHDEELRKRAREVEREAIQAEAARPSRDPAAHALALAERARAHEVPEPEPSALAHQGFRAALARLPKGDDPGPWLARIESFFPRAAAAPPAGSAPDLSRWDRPYANNPADAYRSAPPEARRALDRRLWADAFRRNLKRRADREPELLLTLADEASRRLPDAPDVSTALLERGLARRADDLATLRQAEVERLAGLYRDRLNQPEKARALLKAWLEDQRLRRLSPRDAEGRLALAGQYEQLLGDRDTATALLNEAWALDPGSRDLEQAFLRRGFRKSGGEWVLGEPRGAPAAAERAAPAAETPAEARAEAVAPSDDPPAAPAEAAPRSDSLLNLTPEQVRARMGGKPNRRVRCASQGMVLEQWVYQGPRDDQYINIAVRPGESRPRVIAHHVLPRSGVVQAPAP